MTLDVIYHEDCLLGMQRIPDGSVDMILSDLPYGKLECSWDSMIPMDALWDIYRRILKRTGNIVLTAVQPFTAKLILSNGEMFKYSLVWRKSRSGFFAQVKFRPLCEHEDVLVFSYGGTAQNARLKAVYNPQGVQKVNKHCRGKGECAMRPRRSRGPDYVQSGTGYPRSIIEIASESRPIHPTQKPVALFEYLIRTYTNEGETVLDNAMGSGTTAIACLNTNRHYIGFEKDPHYFQIAQQRIAETQPRLIAS